MERFRERQANRQTTARRKRKKGERKEDHNCDAYAFVTDANIKL